MAGAFLGYFFYATTTFVATMALLTCLLDDPRLGIGRHYSRHIITMTITAKAEAHRRLPAKSGTKQASTAKDFGQIRHAVVARYRQMRRD